MHFQQQIKREHQIEPRIVVWEFNLGLQIEKVEILSLAVIALIFFLGGVASLYTKKHSTA
jgi:hypothetical protein